MDRPSYKNGKQYRCGTHLRHVWLERTMVLRAVEGAEVRVAIFLNAKTKYRSPADAISLSLWWSKLASGADEQRVAWFKALSIRVG